MYYEKVIATFLGQLEKEKHPKIIFFDYFNTLENEDYKFPTIYVYDDKNNVDLIDCEQYTLNVKRFNKEELLLDKTLAVNFILAYFISKIYGSDRDMVNEIVSQLISHLELRDIIKEVYNNACKKYKEIENKTEFSDDVRIPTLLLYKEILFMTDMFKFGNLIDTLKNNILACSSPIFSKIIKSEPVLELVPTQNGESSQEVENRYFLNLKEMALNTLNTIRETLCETETMVC